MSINNEGSQVKISQTRPSIDLAKLVKLLTSAIALPADVDRKAGENSDQAKNRPLFIYDQEKQRLKVCTSGVLLRLFQSPAYKKSFDLETAGFIKDYSSSRYGVMRVGGELTEGNNEKLPNLVDQLSASIQQELNASLPVGFDLSNILLDDAKKQFQELSEKLKVLLKEKSDATLIPLTFAESDLKKSDSPKKFAKMIAGTETVEVDADDYFNKFCRSVQEYLKQESDIDSDEMAKVEDCLQTEYQRTNSQIKRFFNFLQTEALSRVRLNTAFHIMSAIKEKAQNYSQDTNHDKYRLLTEYVHRIEQLRDLVKEKGLVIDAGAIYGGIDNIDLVDYLAKTSFFYCLTVWPACETQIFERKNTDQSVVREISYRFRINGKNPQLDKPAFQVRLDQLKDSLLSNDPSISSSVIERSLAQLIFLRVITPDGKKFNVSKDDLQKGIDHILGTLKTVDNGKPLEAIENLLQDLTNREESMKKIGLALIDILRDKGEAIINNVDQATQQQYICIKRTLVNWERLIDAEPGMSEFLGINSDQKKESSYWYQNLEISNTPVTDNILFSIKVQTILSQRNLVEKTDTQDNLPRDIEMERAFTDKLLQVIWVPFNSNDQQYKPSQLISNSKSGQWVLPKSIHIEYEISTLQRNTKNKLTKQHQDLHAAAVSCFTILVYACLWQIIHQIQQSSEENSLFTIIVLRLQDQRDNTAGSGENYIYGIAQAIELILGQDNPLKMQGLIVDNLQKNPYVKQGVFNALMSVFPIHISTLDQPEIPQIGLISYVARPCNGNLQLSDSPKNYLFLQQSYIATAIDQPFTGYHLRTERRKSDLVEEDEMKGQRLIKEEIDYLKNRGCTHIILLSHSYGSRRINRINDYKPRLLEANFLEDLANIFPDLNIYPLLRDVFPATRLYKRYNEAGFEILRANDHSELLKQQQESRLNFVPVYTFATLHAIDEASRPQSGFCIYYLVSDQQTTEIDWMEKVRFQLIDPEQKSNIRPCLLTVLRGLHFIESEKIQGQKFLPVLDPFNWISPDAVETIGEVNIMHNSKGNSNVLLNLPALLTHVANVLHRRKPR